MKIDCGKSGLNDDRTFHAHVTGGGANGPGQVLKATSFDKWTKLPIAEDNRSGSGRSGFLLFDCSTPGVYRAIGFAEDNRREGKVAFRVRESGEAEKLENLAAERAAMREIDPDGAEAADRAERERQQRAERKAEEKRQRIENAERAYAERPAIDFATHAGRLVALVRQPLTEQREPIDGGDDNRFARPRNLAAVGFAVTATGSQKLDTLGPTQAAAESFRLPDPESDGIVGIRLRPGSQPDEDTAADRLFLAKGGDFEEVDAEAFAAAENKARGDEALPALTGSAKQIAWAKDIRARVKAKDPKHYALKKSTRAKWWIDNRNQLPG